jgi:hypothetical protein
MRPAPCDATSIRAFLFVAHFPPPATCIVPQNSFKGMHQQLKLMTVCTPMHDAT